MKRTLSLILILTMLLSLAACGSKDAASTDGGNAPPQEQGSGDAQPGPSTTASKPNAAALRSSVPTFPGSCTPSSIKMRRAVSSVSAGGTGVSNRANTP